MNRLELNQQLDRPKVTVRSAAADIPLQLCMETLYEIPGCGIIEQKISYGANTAIVLEEAVVLVKNAP